MEVVALLSGLIIFSGMPAGIAVSYFSSEEYNHVKKYADLLRKICLVAGLIYLSFTLNIPFAIALSLLSLLFIFFEINTALILSILAFPLIFSKGNIAFASIAFLYSFFIGVSLYSSKKKYLEYVKPIAIHAVFLVALLLFSIFPL